MSIGSSSKVKAEGFSLRYLKIVAALLLATLNAIMKENLKEYFRHSMSRCEFDWNRSKHVHPHSWSGKNHWRNSPVGACPETSQVKQLKVTISPASFMNCLPLPSQMLGSKSFRFCFNLRALESAKVCQAACHSWMCRSLEAMVCRGNGGGPIGVMSAALLASSLTSKPRWLGIHQNSIVLSGKRASHAYSRWQFSLDSSKAEWGFMLSRDLRVA